MDSVGRYRSLRGPARSLAILVVLTGLLLILDTLYVIEDISIVKALYAENLRLEQAREEATRLQTELSLATGRALLYYQIPERYLKRNVGDRGLIWLALGLSLLAWLVWQGRAHANLRSLRVSGLRFRPGMAMAGWLIPLTNLVLPLLSVRELWQASRVAAPAGECLPPPGEWRRAPAALVHLWWAGSLLWVALHASALLVLTSPEGQEVLLALYLMLGSDVLAVVTLLLSLRIVSSVGDWQSTRHLSARAALVRRT